MTVIGIIVIIAIIIIIAVIIKRQLRINEKDHLHPREGAIMSSIILVGKSAKKDCLERRRKRNRASRQRCKKRKVLQKKRKALQRAIRCEFEDVINNIDTFYDFEKHSALKAHKESLPLSIQRIIEFAQQRIKYDKVIELDYDEIEKDLQYQYTKYNGDKTKLRKLYFDYKEQYTRNKEVDSVLNKRSKAFTRMYFAKPPYHLAENTYYDRIENHTLVHYLMDEILFGKLIRDDPALILMKLLIKNNIIDCDEIMHTTTWDGGQCSLVGMILYGCVQPKRRNEITLNIEHFVDLNIYVQQQQQTKSNEKHAEPCIMRISIDRPTEELIEDFPLSVSHRLLGNWVSWLNFSYCPDEDPVDNGSQLIERILMRGVLPFQIEYQDIYGTDNDTKQSLLRLFTEFNICENTSDEELVVNRRKFPKNLMALVSPLVVLPHLNRAKAWMNELLVECGVFKELASIICNYLYLGYSVFYGEEIQNNLNVQTMVFFTHLAHFAMDKQFVSDFYEVYNNAEFVGYIVDNYLCTLSIVFKEVLLIDFAVIMSLIQTYNDNNDQKFPLEGAGVYCILQKLMYNPSFDGETYCESFIKLLRFITGCYKDEFNINHTYLMTNLMGSRFKWSAMNVMKFILTEFKNECDINDPSLIYQCLYGNQDIEKIKFLFTNGNCSLDKTSITMENELNEGHICGFCDELQEKNREFIRNVEKYCFTLLDESKESIDKFIKIALKCFCR